MKKSRRFLLSKLSEREISQIFTTIIDGISIINLTFEYEFKLVHSFYPRPIMFIPCFVILKANHDHYFIVQSNQLNILYFFHYMCYFFLLWYVFLH